MSLFIIMLVMCLVNKKGTPSPTIKGTYLFIYIYIPYTVYTNRSKVSPVQHLAYMYVNLQYWHELVLVSRA